MCYDNQNFIKLKHQEPVVQSMDNVIHQINCSTVDKCWQNKLQYAIHWIMLYLVDGIRARELNQHLKKMLEKFMTYHMVIERFSWSDLEWILDQKPTLWSIVQPCLGLQLLEHLQGKPKQVRHPAGSSFKVISAEYLSTINSKTSFQHFVEVWH